jgi:hypothetical protein
MNVSATYNGAVVQFVEIEVDGCQIYPVYRTTTGNLMIGRIFLSGDNTLLATGAIVN